MTQGSFNFHEYFLPMLEGHTILKICEQRYGEKGIHDNCDRRLHSSASSSVGCIEGITILTIKDGVYYRTTIAGIYYDGRSHASSCHVIIETTKVNKDASPVSSKKAFRRYMKRRGLREVDFIPFIHEEQDKIHEEQDKENNR
jgi:hypothetical protein